jgi:hypothetical protein
MHQSWNHHKTVPTGIFHLVNREEEAKEVKCQNNYISWKSNNYWIQQDEGHKCVVYLTIHFSTLKIIPSAT